ncbi:hypothetical protein HBI56_146630 [Parastagonospora nodorum]|nr:hypothetical protein HBH56_078220 [Parastagonospora nodorum]KAH3923476.1 hypothetical protein HBH54_209730 [Parastagonospora nodorum]KAH3952283.1 hypothetical protein HBH53_049900 [Parastagonospora nodorum]KAH3981702.1 hypothetical protein HBH51_045120 [Parastagonospora nodorum]KAH3983258.1 hypothetical protein HBH52_072720 [Parastagonospora nodorum]
MRVNTRFSRIDEPARAGPMTGWSYGRLFGSSLKTKVGLGSPCSVSKSTRGQGKPEGVSYAGASFSAKVTACSSIKSRASSCRTCSGIRPASYKSTIDSIPPRYRVVV